MKVVYGPVSSWRLGRSLGIDLIGKEAKEKVCSFDCVYCQAGPTIEKTNQRRIFVPSKIIKRDIDKALDRILHRGILDRILHRGIKVDVITFSGNGEPTLAKNLEEIIDYLRKKTNLPLAILTNSSLMPDPKVRKELSKLDIVIAKLDAGDEFVFKKINWPVSEIKFEEVVEGIKDFRKSFNGKLALQIMFVPGNTYFDWPKKIAQIAGDIDLDEIQINTPLRPCRVQPLSKEMVFRIKEEFVKFELKKIITVYETKKPKVIPLDLEEVRKRKRPGS